MLSPVEVSLQAHPQSVGVLPVVNEELCGLTLSHSLDRQYMFKNIFSISLCLHLYCYTMHKKTTEGDVSELCLSSGQNTDLGC